MEATSSGWVAQLMVVCLRERERERERGLVTWVVEGGRERKKEEELSLIGDERHGHEWRWS